MYQKLTLLFLAFFFLQGCAAYGIYDDKRLIDTMSDDKALATAIKSDLLEANFKGGWAIAVYCYYGNVFLVGDVPENMREKARSIAVRHKPRTLTQHWFEHIESDKSNFGLATSLRTELIKTKGLSSTRIDTEVNAGRVVLLGVVADENEKQIAIQSARKVSGVTRVTSYLILPPRASGPVHR